MQEKTYIAKQIDITGDKSHYNVHALSILSDKITIDIVLNESDSTFVCVIFFAGT